MNSAPENWVLPVYLTQNAVWKLWFWTKWDVGPKPFSFSQDGSHTKPPPQLPSPHWLCPDTTHTQGWTSAHTLSLSLQAQLDDTNGAKTHSLRGQMQLMEKAVKLCCCNEWALNTIRLRQTERLPVRQLYLW